MSDEVTTVRSTDASLPYWRAVRAGRAVGSIRAWVRPDERCFLRLDDGTHETYTPLLTAARRHLRRPLHVTVDETDVELLREVTRLGFDVARRQSNYAIPVPEAYRHLADSQLPPGVSLMTAAEADEDELRRLDEALRQDVPGTDGWKWTVEDFREENYDSPAFDPSLYWVAAEGPRYIGICRIWNNRAGPRVGLLGVLAPYRRRGIAKALLRRPFQVLASRGESKAVTEADDFNHRSRRLLSQLGASRTGGSFELVTGRVERSAQAEA